MILIQFNKNGNRHLDDNLRKLIENEQKQHEDRIKKTIAEEMTLDGDLLPPWKKYPDMLHGSIGWRMGYEESYMIAWDKWASLLRKQQLIEYFKNTGPFLILRLHTI